MHKQQALTDFSRVSQANFSTDTRLTVTELTQNSNVYPNPPITMAILSGQIDVWDGIIKKPDYPGKANDLKNTRTLIEGSIKQNGTYVNSIAQGDLAKLAKSGYQISKAHTPVGDLLPPDSVDITNGTAPNTFDIDIAIVDNAWGYLFAFTPVSNTEKDPNLWTIKWSAKHTNTFGGFISGTQYKFAACAVGSSNNVFWKNAPNNLFAQ
jgi:hypothetical protein